MRALFLFLVLANAVFAVWVRYIAPAEATIDPAPLGRQIDAEKLKILGPGEIPAALQKPAPPAAVPTVAAAPAPAAPVPAPPASAACMEWGSFTLADAPRAEKALEPLSLGGRLGQRRTEEKAGWWVFIPSQGDRQGAMKKAAQLKALGVDEYFVVLEEELRWSLSLGVFRNEEAAQARLLALREKGVRSAQVGPRETVVPKVWLQVKGVDAALESRLKDIARQVEGSELKNCPS
jgi:SPOR domain